MAAERDHAATVTGEAGLHAVPDGAWWVPPTDPHRDTIGAVAPPARYGSAS